MCYCEQPNVNGTTNSTYHVNPPSLSDGDVLMYDQPGRCGGIDSHSHHFRVVRSYSTLHLLVRHGGGDERIRLHFYGADFLAAVAAMDSNTRYWMLLEIYNAHKDASREGRASEAERWSSAAAEGRIKTRKLPKQGRVKVWIEDSASGAH